MNLNETRKRMTVRNEVILLFEILKAIRDANNMVSQATMALDTCLNRYKSSTLNT